MLAAPVIPHSTDRQGDSVLPLSASKFLTNQGASYVADADAKNMENNNGNATCWVRIGN